MAAAKDSDHCLEVNRTVEMRSRGSPKAVLSQTAHFDIHLCKKMTS